MVNSNCSVKSSLCRKQRQFASSALAWLWPFMYPEWQLQNCNTAMLYSFVTKKSVIIQWTTLWTLCSKRQRELPDGSRANFPLDDMVNWLWGKLGKKSPQFSPISKEPTELLKLTSFYPSHHPFPLPEIPHTKKIQTGTKKYMHNMLELFNLLLI